MVMQLEDCIDCLTVLYLHIDFVFLLDHSCGHDRQRDDGLNVAKVLGVSNGVNVIQKSNKKKVI